MAKDEKKKLEAAETEAPAARVAAEAVVAASEPAPGDSLPVTFDRWFRTKNRPPHHVHGMKAYANTSGKKTIAQWDAIFASY